MNGPDPLQAFRLQERSSLALTGAGGKSGLLFWLARSYAQEGRAAVLSVTTQLGLEQAKSVRQHLICRSSQELPQVNDLAAPHSILVTGSPTETGKLAGLDRETIAALDVLTRSAGSSLLIEADGSRQRPLKAPAPHEPVVPIFAQNVGVVAGLAGIGRRLDSEAVHRPERFARLASARIGETITPDMVVRVLLAKDGGLQGIPPKARTVAVLTQADSEKRRGIAASMASHLLGVFNAVVICDLGSPSRQDHLKNQARAPRIYAVIEPVAAVILAAGGSTRFKGRSKPMLEWRGASFVRTVAKTALQAGLSPVVVVSGGDAEVARAVKGLEVEVVHNPDWQSGQSTSVRVGVEKLPEITGAAVFLLADQPQITESLVRAVIERHREQFSQVVAPIIDDQRGNPVLFDREAFSALRKLTGDQGGRTLFSRYRIDWVPWHDPRMLLDVDTPEDYQKLIDTFS